MANLFSRTVLSSHLFGKLEPHYLNVVRQLRGVKPEVAKTLKQKLEEIEKLQKDPTLHFKVNIGLPQLKTSRSEEYRKRVEAQKCLRSNPQLLKSPDEISLGDINREWLKTCGPFHVKAIAEHFNIFEDLFGEAYFIPRVSLDVKYLEEDGTCTPVCFGNQIKPFQANKTPIVNFDSDPSSLWSLLVTNPDGHFTESESEYIHWFIGNIPGGDITKGETLVEYLQPFPSRGTGLQRMIFILYKQDGKVDFEAYKKKSCHVLAERTFKTREFYSKFQDCITPAGLAFFQTDWDPSLTKFFHHTLEMKEPIYEYDFPVPYKKPPVWFPKKEAFNLYMDKHRDPKQISKELLVKHLKTVDPFKPPEKEFRFPNALPEKTGFPSWYRVELRKQRLKWGRYHQS